MRTIRVGLVTGLAALFLAGPAWADFSYDYMFDQPSYAVAPGGTVDVGILLREVVSGSDASRLATDGLIGAGVRVSFDVAPLPGAPAQVLSTADILPNTTAFDASALLSLDLVPGSSAGLSEAVDVASPAAFGTLVAPGTYQVFLGTFRFTAGPVPGEVTDLRATDFSSATTENVTGAGLALDPLIANGTATIRVRAVPEPGGLMLLALGLAGSTGYATLRSKSPANPSITDVN